MPSHNLSEKDFGYCETCKTFYDLWKFDFSVENAGHGACVTRAITPEELPACIKGCEEPVAHCKECGAVLNDTPDETLGHIYYCGFCQKEYLPDEIRWENCFGECLSPQDQRCQGCDYLGKVFGGTLVCAKDGPCTRKA
ncbi:MAG: hypothetical protein WC554_06115 [Clostridia bacterium]